MHLFTYNLVKIIFISFSYPKFSYMSLEISRNSIFIDYLHYFVSRSRGVNWEFTMQAALQCYNSRDEPKKYLSEVMCGLSKACLIFSTGPHPLQYTALVALNKIIDVCIVHRLTSERQVVFSYILLLFFLISSVFLLCSGIFILFYSMFLYICMNPVCASYLTKERSCRLALRVVWL